MFSVVMPTYNSGNFIGNSIQSVLNQKYKNFELIVVDDGSVDDTAAVVATYSDKRIKYIYQDNAGVSAARNRGIVNSTGKYICFLDSDDEWKDNHLEVLFDLINQYKECDFFATGYDVRLRNGKIFHKSQKLLENINENSFMYKDGYRSILENGYYFNTNTVCCNRDVFDKVGMFAVGVKNSEDDDMWLRIFAYHSVAVSKKVTAIYNRANSNATAKLPTNESRFSKRVDALLSSEEVDEGRKCSLRIWKERNKLSRCRKLIMQGQKCDAMVLFRQIDSAKVLPQKYISTLVAMLVPTKIIKFYVELRDREYYQESTRGKL